MKLIECSKKVKLRSCLMKASVLDTSAAVAIGIMVAFVVRPWGTGTRSMSRMRANEKELSEREIKDGANYMRCLRLRKDDRYKEGFDRSHKVHY